MSLDLTPCGHLKGVTCPKCAPQKQERLGDEDAAKLMVSTITPLIEQWFLSGQITAQQAAGNLMGMSVAIALQVGLPKEQLIAYLETIYKDEV